jgi:4-hydroxybenzoate polyprenyltransferase
MPVTDHTDSVAEQSAGLRSELGLGDLVLTQILFIVGLPWVGVAAKLGPAHVLFWLFAILNTSETGIQVTQYLQYIAGGDTERVTGSPWFITAVSTLIIAGLVAVTARGLSVGRWVHKAGGVLMLVTFGMLLALPWLHVARESLPACHPLMVANLIGYMIFAGGRRIRMS